MSTMHARSVDNLVCEAVSMMSDATHDDVTHYVFNQMTRSEIKYAALLYVRSAVNVERRLRARLIERETEVTETTEPVKVRKVKTVHLPLNDEPESHEDRERRWLEIQARNKARETDQQSLVSCLLKHGRHSDEYVALFKELRGRWGADAHDMGALAAISEFRSEIRTKARIELTEELLGSDFALGDGRRVTWRDATIEDHEQRIELLQRNVIGNMKTLDLHIKAVRMITDDDVHSLGEIKLTQEVVS